MLRPIRMLAARGLVVRGAGRAVGGWTSAPLKATSPSYKWMGGVAVTRGASDLQVRPMASVAHAAPDPSTSMLQVKWGGEKGGGEGGSDVYPYLWLRDNCQCPSCFHPSSMSRAVLLWHLHRDLTPRHVKVSGDGGKVEVEWSDGHLATYPSAWLHERAFNSTQQDHQLKDLQLPEMYWGRELQEDLPVASFPQLLEEDESLLRFLKQLEEVGLVVVQQVPCQEGMIHRLAQRVCHVKITHYGDTYFVEEKVNANNLAYTPYTLDFHTDVPYLTYKAGIQMLHCIRQFPGEGGDNLLADSFHVARQLRHAHPAHFHTLTHTLTQFTDQGSEDGAEFFIRRRVPMIKLDHDGRIETVNFNQMVRDSFFAVTPDDAAAWYTAMLAFRDLLYQPENHIQYKLKDGEMAVFNNLRVLHGRLGYSDGNGTRKLQGAYWDWDGVRSRRRVLQDRLGHTIYPQEPPREGQH